MASWWLTRIAWNRISPGKARALDQDLRARDGDFCPTPLQDFDVQVYHDGLRGLWRAPMVRPDDLRALLEHHHIEVTAFYFAPAKCLTNGPECLCQKNADYGCNLVDLPEAEAEAGLGPIPPWVQGELESQAEAACAAADKSDTQREHSPTDREFKAAEGIVGEVVLIDTGGTHEGVGDPRLRRFHRWERARIKAIVGGTAFFESVARIAGVPVVGDVAAAQEEPTTERLRESYRDVRIGPELRLPTDDEIRTMHEEGRQKRWVEVEFVEPGDARTGLFSTFRRIPADLNESVTEKT